MPFAPDQTPAIQVSGQRLQLLFSAFRRAWALPACCPSPHQPQALHSLFLPLTPGDFFFSVSVARAVIFAVTLLNPIYSILLNPI